MSDNTKNVDLGNSVDDNIGNLPNNPFAFLIEALQRNLQSRNNRNPELLSYEFPNIMRSTEGAQIDPTPRNNRMHVNIANNIHDAANGVAEHVENEEGEKEMNAHQEETVLRTPVPISMQEWMARGSLDGELPESEEARQARATWCEMAQRAAHIENQDREQLRINRLRWLAEAEQVLAAAQQAIQHYPQN